METSPVQYKRLDSELKALFVEKNFLASELRRIQNLQAVNNNAIREKKADLNSVQTWMGASIMLTNVTMADKLIRERQALGDDQDSNESKEPCENSANLEGEVAVDGEPGYEQQQVENGGAVAQNGRAASKK